MVGIPVDLHPQKKIPTLEVVLTEAAHENEPRLAVFSCHGRR